MPYLKIIAVFMDNRKDPEILIFKSMAGLKNIQYLGNIIVKLYGGLKILPL